MSNQRKFRPTCGAPNDISSAHCVSCGAALPVQGPPPPPQYGQPPMQYPQQPPMAYTQPVQSVSILWYAVAILFGLIGAIVGWYVNKDKNPAAAKNILIVGVVSWAIQYYLFLA